jgi:hypothetical protein
VEADAPVRSLPPKGSETFRIHFVPELSERANYSIRLSYANFAREVGKQRIVVGELLSRPISVDVR